MICPHCKIGIREEVKSQTLFNEPQRVKEGRIVCVETAWSIEWQICCECDRPIIFIRRSFPGNSNGNRFLAYPENTARLIPDEITEPYRQDFVEACAVLKSSPKASAALSRRCLQAILRDKANTQKKDLYDQIEEVISANAVPSYIAHDLHAVRVIGNFAAHPQKSAHTGEILGVETGEAEWNLDVIEVLFDFYFVGPSISLKRREELNEKLKAAGKPKLE
jgi:hypothetical protein